MANLKEKVEKEKIKVRWILSVLIANRNYDWISAFVSFIDKNQALGSRNALESIGIQKELHRQQLVVLINEKRQELERLNSLEQSLIRDEAEQKDLIERLTNQRW